MSHYPGHVALGAAVVVVFLILRAASRNRYVRRKLGLSIALGILYLVGQAALPFIAIDARLDANVRSWETLLIALSILNGLLVVTINPLRDDRVPERFPGIVQDAILLGLYLIVATFVFKEQLLTTSAVGAVVVGFALQDTLGNAFAGLAIQMEKPFRVGHWVGIAGYEGRVSEITWRATKLHTKTGNFVVLPNNIISKEAVTNYSEPVAPTRLQVEVGASYLASPGEVKSAMQDALANCRRILKTPAPDVLLVNFDASAITYRARFWVQDYAQDEAARDEVRTAIYYSFRRHNIEIPWPIQVQYERDEVPGPDKTVQMLARVALLSRLDIFKSLSDQERERLAAAAREHLYGDGDCVVRQGEPGGSMFVVSSGTAVVTVEPGGEVARIESGGYFGEMSLLTGEPRTATVAARGDTVVIEIDADMFKQIAATDPSILEKVGAVAMKRREELHAVRASAATAAAPETRANLLLRMRRFLGI